MQILADCYASTKVNLATALGFFQRMCSLLSLELPESEHQLFTALSVQSWPGVLQMIQKHIKKWKVGLEIELGFPVSEDYSLPMNAKFFVGSVMANFCEIHHPLHMSMVESSSQRVMIDKTSSVPKCVRLARMSHRLHQLLKKKWGAVPSPCVEDLSDTWREKLLNQEKENS